MAFLVLQSLELWVKQVFVIGTGKASLSGLFGPLKKQREKKATQRLEKPISPPAVYFSVPSQLSLKTTHHHEGTFLLEHFPQDKARKSLKQ